MSFHSTLKRNKYKAVKTEVDGIIFHSKKESARYIELKMFQDKGLITGLALQPRFPILIDGKPVKIKSAGYPKGRAVKYLADFSYTITDTNEIVVEDVKGMDTSTSRLKRALVEAIYGITVKVI